MLMASAMRWAGLLPLLLVAGCAGPTTITRDAPAESFKTHKTVADLEICLTSSLSKLDDITSVNTAGVTTLLYGDRAKPSMLIDLAPGKVTVTTNFAPGTRSLIVACI